MKCVVSIAPEIRNELQSISDYVSEEAEDSAVGERVVKAIAKKILSLEELPNAHSRYPDKRMQDVGIRYVTVNWWVILFTVDDDNAIVEVHHVFHEFRNATRFFH